MRKRQRDFSIFNLSMLDVMTGALGAVMLIMIVLLTQKIGIESKSCQTVVEELKTTTSELIKTREELKKTRKALAQIKKPSLFERIFSISTLVKKTSESIDKTVNKIKKVKRELFKISREKDMMAFEIPNKIVMVVDLSGSMSAAGNKEKEDRLSQLKAALKMFIAGMANNYSIDILFFPAFKENIDNNLCPTFKITPPTGNACKKFDLRDEAYDDKNISCYKFGYFNGSLKPIQKEADKYYFYKNISCFKAYHDTPTRHALTYVLQNTSYKAAQGIVLFSDGEPDSIRKKIITLDKLLNEIKRLNTGKKKIFTIGIGKEFRNQENTPAVIFLKDLAAQNNGFYIGF